VKVNVNGERAEVPDGSTLQELVDARLAASTGVAAAVDGSVVPRGAWPTVVLRPGQSVELLTAVPGG
jgi:sulfur carrier protein